MAAPTYVPGQVLTADDCNNWFTPDVAVKTADQSVTNNTTIANDTQLFLPLAANAKYKFEMFLDYEGGAGGSSDIAWNFTVPGTAFLRYWVAYTDAVSGVNVITTAAGSTTLAARSAGAGLLEGAEMIGTIFNGATAGTLQFRWAQNHASATSTIVHAQTMMMLTRIG